MNQVVPHHSCYPGSIPPHTRTHTPKRPPAQPCTCALRDETRSAFNASHAHAFQPPARWPTFCARNCTLLLAGSEIRPSAYFTCHALLTHTCTRFHMQARVQPPRNECPALLQEMRVSRRFTPPLTQTHAEKEHVLHVECLTVTSVCMSTFRQCMMCVFKPRSLTAPCTRIRDPTPPGSTCRPTFDRALPTKGTGCSHALSHRVRGPSSHPCTSWSRRQLLPSLKTDSLAIKAFQAAVRVVNHEPARSQVPVLQHLNSNLSWPELGPCSSV